MSEGLVIRTGQGQDGETLARFNVAMAWETERKKLDESTVLRGVREVLRNPKHGFYVVAARGDDVVGSLLVTFEWSDWRCAAFWWIQSLYVKPEFRRRGVFRKLHQFVKTKAQAESKVCGIRLYTEQSNHAAQAVYARIGLVKTGYRVYEQPLSE